MAAKYKVALAFTIVVFLTLATALARTKAPWCDEGWFANPAYNLAFHGQMGTNVLEPSGHFLNAYLSGIQERTYLMVPNHMVALAGWFRIFGFSLFIMRAYSIAWGAVGLLIFFYILAKLFPDPRVAVWGTLFTAIDFVYLWSSADGRMDASSNAMALASVAIYLHFRERDFTKAVSLSQIVGAVAVFTHPNALLILLAVPVLAWRFDRGKIRLMHVALAVAPYVVFGMLWTVYILQSPGDFAAQFLANAAGRKSERWKVIIQPWIAVWLEIARHLATYSVSSLWSGDAKGRSIFLPLAYIGAAVSFIKSGRSYGGSERMFLTLMLSVVLSMTFLNGFKASNYLIYLIPFYCAALAFSLLRLSNRGLSGTMIAIFIGAGLAWLQLADSVDHIRADEYHRQYEPTIALLRAEQASGKTIIGTAALGFGLGFHGFSDDWRLGLYSGLKPDILVLDRSYRYFTQRFETDEPPVFSHLVTTLTQNYRLSEQFGEYWIFSDNGRRSSVDMKGMALKKNGEKAEYLFKELSKAGSYSPNVSVSSAKIKF
jgi:hypothetical protein